MKNLQQKAKEIRLTPQEKAAMRMRLFGAPGHSPTGAAPSPISIHKSPYILISHKWATALAALLVVVFTGGSSALAAQGALPGQPLYGLKTAVIEPIKVALAPNAAARATVHAALAQVRIEEAETLAQNGSLDATTSLQLADSFDAHSNAALALADEASATDPSAPAQVEAQLDASSKAGSAVLVALAERSNTGKVHSQTLAVRLLARSNKESSVPAAAKIQAFAATAPMAMRATFAGDASSSESGSGSEAAIQLELKAQSAIAQAHAFASSTASTSEAAFGALKSAETYFSQASQALKDNDDALAAQDFARALGSALRAQALIKAEAKFDIRPDTEGHDGSDNGGSSGEGEEEVELHL